MSRYKRTCWGVPEEIRDLLRAIYKEVTGEEYPFYSPFVDNIEKNLSDIEKRLGLDPTLGNHSHYLPEDMSERLSKLLSRVQETSLNEKKILAYLWITLIEMGYEPQRIKGGIRKVLYGLEL